MPPFHIHVANVEHLSSGYINFRIEIINCFLLTPLINCSSCTGAHTTHIEAKDKYRIKTGLVLAPVDILLFEYLYKYVGDYLYSDVLKKIKRSDNLELKLDGQPTDDFIFCFLLFLRCGGFGPR